MRKKNILAQQLFKVEKRKFEIFNFTVIFDVFRNLKLKLQFTNYSSMAYGSSKVVEHSTYYPKFMGLNPAAVGIGREKIDRKDVLS